MKTFEHPNNEKQFTGRQLVLIDKDAKKSTIKRYSRNAGVKLVSSEEVSSDFSVNAILQDVGGVVFEELGIGIIDEKSNEMSALMNANGGNPFYYSEPETYMYAMPNVDYIKGFKDAASLLYQEVSNENPNKINTKLKNELIGNNTWGIEKTEVMKSSFTGSDVNVAILDTGFYGEHPDFVGRNIVGQSFVDDERWNEDGNGHGTHVVGTACGNISIRDGRRYGVATESNIYVGKVLNNRGSGEGGNILAGINWAIKNKCQVISMSLGGRVDVGQTPSPIYENAGRRALEKGSLIIAAAGNDSRRPRIVRPVSSPANCKSIFSVGAVGQQDNIAYFSNGGINLDGGKIDIAGPGVGIFSAWTELNNGSLYKTIKGTSMATPHVSGIAALLFQAYPNATPAQIWMMLVQNAKGIGLPTEDVGAGLVQAI